MALRKRSKADSTENLLDIIRENGDAAPSSSRSQAPSAGRKSSSRSKPAKPRIKVDAKRRPKARRTGGLFSGGSKNLVVAVDVQPDYLGLVKLMRKEGRHRILDMERVPVPQGSQPGSTSFEGLLRSSLKRFTKGAGKPEIWSLLRSVDVDIGTLLVPRGAGGGLSNAVYWQMQKEKKFDPQEYVLDYRLLGQTKDGGVAKNEVMTCLVRRNEVDAHKKLFQRVGFPLTGLATIPSAFLNVYAAGWCDCGDALCANVRVDDDFSCITIFQTDKVLFSRTIKAGTNSMAEELMDWYNSRGGQGAQGGELSGPEGLDLDLFDEPEPELDRKPVMSLGDARKVVMARFTDEPLGEGVAGSELTRDEVLEAVSPAVDRIARQAERTLDYHYSRTSQRCECLHLSGEVFVSQEVRNMISSQLGIEAMLFEPLRAIGQSGLTSRMDRAECLWFNEALSLALSNTKRTMNLCYTYQDQAARQKRVLANNLVAAAAVLLALVAAGAYVWGLEMVKDRKVRLAGLQKELASQPRVDEAVLVKAAAEAGQSLDRLRAVSWSYQGLAVLHELEQLTPQNIRLVSMQVDLGLPGEEGAAAAATAQGEGKENLRVLVVEGLVLGQAQQFESVLTRYLISLKGSPLVSDAMVQMSQAEEFVPEGQVLHFIMQIALS